MAAVRWMAPVCLLASFIWVGPAAAEATMVLPRPAVEVLGEGTVRLTAKGGDLAVAWPAGAVQGAILEGRKLLLRRLKALGHTLSESDASEAAVVVARCDEATLAGLCERHNLAPLLEANRRRQAYHLQAGTTAGGKPRVALRAVSDWGLYYGLVTLCQLLDVDDAGALRIPTIEVLDFPEIGHRLAKTSAANPPEVVARFVAWLPLLKISQVGLQYHGRSSKRPEPDFTANVERLCPRLRREGTIETIVYFCPFRASPGKATGPSRAAYDFSVEADAAAYGDYLLWIMAQGAHGIEVDYNDWPGSREVPIADVINLAFERVRRKHPDAYVLYCPPAQGDESYRGLPTAALRQTLSRVPPAVWPLWTGPTTLIEKPLTSEAVEQFTRQAGRRPFLWVNRVAWGVDKAFVTTLPAGPGGESASVFRGDFLPRDLNRLFEGVHLNAGLSPQYNRLPGAFDTKALVYLATAADFLWNPRAWNAQDSLRRAARFVEIMNGLPAGPDP